MQDPPAFELPPAWPGDAFMTAMVGAGQAAITALGSALAAREASKAAANAAAAAAVITKQESGLEHCGSGARALTPETPRLLAAAPAAAAALQPAPLPHYLSRAVLRQTTELGRPPLMVSRLW